MDSAAEQERWRGLGVDQSRCPLNPLHYDK
jgi:hypothetical protein